MSCPFCSSLFARNNSDGDTVGHQKHHEDRAGKLSPGNDHFECPGTARTPVSHSCTSSGQTTSTGPGSTSVARKQGLPLRTATPRARAAFTGPGLCPERPCRPALGGREEAAWSWQSKEAPEETEPAMKLLSINNPQPGELNPPPNGSCPSLLLCNHEDLPNVWERPHIAFLVV